MSQWQKLINQMCPNGVEWKTLGEVCEIGTGNSNRQDSSDDGQYPFFVRSKDVLKINSFEFDDESIIIPGEGGIGDIFHYINGKYALHQRAYRVHPTSDKLSGKFLYYYLFANFKLYINSKAVNATVTSIRKPMLEGFPIPVPPLEIQTRIVEILDYFTNLTANINTELNLRRKQFEYYREKLLSLDGVPGVEWKKLGEVGKVCMCKRIMKYQTTELGDIPFFKIGTFGNKPDAYISKELFEEYKTKYSFPRKGEILISAAGTIGKTVVYDGQPAYYQDSNIVWLANDESKVSNPYLSYCYQMSPWKISGGGTIARLYNDNIANAEIPVPPLAVQQSIVEKLDKFTALIENIEKELDLRQKQYEYYREQLLSFQNS